MQDDYPSINELQNFLDEIESLAPTREETEGVRVCYRPISAEDIIDDSLPFDESPFEDYETDTGNQNEPEQTESPIYDFQIYHAGPVVAVDCGIARLGETENGLVIALRASIIANHDGRSDINLFRTGPMYLHNQHKLELLYQMGRHLDKPELFVEIDTTTDPAHPRPTKVKSGVAHDAHKYGDRFRNWFERLTQKIAATKIENGTVLLDGALTLRTIDTPNIFLENLASLCHSRGNALIAISKQSMLQVQGKSVRFWLDDAPNRPCYRCLTPLMGREERQRVLGRAYAARFSALGPTFRMDVKAIEGQGDDEAINKFFSSTMMRGGYPDILVSAHAHSYFTSPDVIQLQAQAGAKYSLVPRGEVDLSGIFGPFGGRFK
jgi:hypothetical protein